MGKRIFAGLLAVALFLGFQYFYPGNSGIPRARTGFEIVAHRGAHVMWEKGAYDPVTGCEAGHIRKPSAEQTYIENTLESIGHAFDCGATMVEMDIRRSRDNQLMIFHDEDLACRTNGSRRVADRTLDYLKSLDIGYGYTFDNGKTFPFRGKGVGKMPTLTEVLRAFPGRKFLIDHKDGSAGTARLFLDGLRKLPVENRKRLFYWGPKETYQTIRLEAPEITRLFPSRGEIKNTILPYVLSAGILDFAKVGTGLNLGMNRKISRCLWGWPYRFLEKAHRNNNGIFLMVDTIADARYFENVPADGIVTDFIEIIGPYFREKGNR